MLATETQLRQCCAGVRQQVCASIAAPCQLHPSQYDMFHGHWTPWSRQHSEAGRTPNKDLICGEEMIGQACCVIHRFLKMSGCPRQTPYWLTLCNCSLSLFFGAVKRPRFWGRELEVSYEEYMTFSIPVVSCVGLRHYGVPLRQNQTSMRSVCENSSAKSAPAAGCLERGRIINTVELIDGT